MHKVRGIGNKATWILGLFIALILVGLYFTEVFQGPKKLIEGQNFYENPITDEWLENLTELKYSNKFGEVTLVKKFMDDDNKEVWKMVRPRSLPANDLLVDRILTALGKLKIRRIFIKDKLNRTNFSLDDPIMKISLKTNDSKELKLELGVINPVDNSSFVTLNNKKYIYQIDRFNYSLDSLRPKEFIDSRIVSLSSDEIKKIELYRGEKKTNSNLISLNFHSGKWTNNRNAPLEEKKVEDFLQKLTLTKGVMILDRQTEVLDWLKDQYLKRPSYTLEIQDKENNSIKYYISQIIHTAIPELKIEKKQNFLIKASNREHPFVLNKDSLSLFYIRESNFKK